MAFSDFIDVLLNKSPGRVIEEQIKVLYNRLYPLIAQDFRTIFDDRAAWIQHNIEENLRETRYNAHSHLTTDGPPTLSPATAPIPAATVPTEVIAISLIIPVGVPQPTGEGIPALLPVRVSSPLDQVATPPLNPNQLGIV